MSIMCIAKVRTMGWALKDINKREHVSPKEREETTAEPLCGHGTRDKGQS